MWPFFKIQFKSSRCRFSGFYCSLWHQVDLCNQLNELFIKVKVIYWPLSWIPQSQYFQLSPLKLLGWWKPNHVWASKGWLNEKLWWDLGQLTKMAAHLWLTSFDNISGTERQMTLKFGMQNWALKPCQVCTKMTFVWPGPVFSQGQMGSLRHL